ncbi:hypothetical protein J2Z70_005133 [Paenibacillus silagei]|uniref:DUF3990 domain-containing protein n=2 Tax=Paenibacillus silagei TaxID=1670801 RepID=A0ABS4NY12_9BACL|nr:hypothetical protein [Paenibacillus silagei]
MSMVLPSLFKAPHVTYGSDELDFGQVFYVTSDPAQAKVWARKLLGDAGLVMKFTVDAKEFSLFKGLVIKSANGNWERYVTLGRQWNLTDNYDYVAGPFVANSGDVRKGETPIPKGKPIAIRSTKMAVWLFKGFAGFEN